MLDFAIEFESKFGAELIAEFGSGLGFAAGAHSASGSELVPEFATELGNR